MLADTAMVGHLGTPELAALAIAGTLLTGSFTLFNFLTYGTTAQVARLHGAGRKREAGQLAAQALWLSTAIGVALMVLIAALAGPLVSLIGGEGRTGDLATDYVGHAGGVARRLRPLALLSLQLDWGIVGVWVRVARPDRGAPGHLWGALSGHALGGGRRVVLH